MGSAVMKHGLHTVALYFLLYFGMKLVLKQSNEVACTRSAVIAAAVFIYMVVFGHKFPPREVNPSLKF